MEEEILYSPIQQNNMDFDTSNEIRWEELLALNKDSLLHQEGDRLNFASQYETVPAGQGYYFSELFREAIDIPKSDIPENVLIQNSNCNYLEFNKQIKEEGDDELLSSSMMKNTSPVHSPHKSLQNDTFKLSKASAVESMDIGTASDGFEQSVGTSMNCSRGFCSIFPQESRKILTNETSMIDEDGDTPLHIFIAKSCDGCDSSYHECAIHIRGNQQLFKPYVNIANNRRQTPLHMAVFIEDKELIRILLEFGATLNVFDERLNTPLHLALEKSMIGKDTYEIIELMLEHNVNNNDVIDALNDKGLTAIHLAAETMNLELMKLLCRFKANINIQERKSGFSPLMKVIEQGLAKRYDISEQKKYFKFANSIVTQLKADVNVRSYSDDSPLHFACAANNKDLVLTLLNAGAEVNEKNIDRRTEKDLTCNKDIKNILEPMFRRKRRKRLRHEDI